MLTRQTVIWSKRETTYGTDPAMSSADGLLAWDVNLDIKGEQLTRDVLRDTLSPIAHVIGLKEVELTFKTEIRGMTAVTNTASYEMDDLLGGCGFNTGVYSGTTTVYSLVSNDSSIGSVSFYVHMGDSSAGNRHKITGARGTVKFNLAAGKYGEAEWKFNGLYNSVISATLPGLSSVTSVQPPIVYNSSFQIAGFSPVCSAAEIDLAVDVTRRDSLNAAQGVHSFRITGRKPKLSFDLDAVVEASYAQWTNWEAGVVSTWAVQVGTSNTNTTRFAGYFENIQPKYGDSDGVRKYDVEAALVSSNPSTGNDEFTITLV